MISMFVVVWILLAIAIVFLVVGVNTDSNFCFVGFIASLALAFTVVVLCGSPVSKKVENQTWKYDIAALSDSTRIERGSLYTVRENDYYFVMKKVGEDQYVMAKYPTNCTTIVEDGGKYVRTHTYRWILFGKIYADDDERKYDIHVPKGSVVQKFAIDLEK